LVAAHALRIARLSEVRTQELRRLCPLFADRAQEGGKPTGLAPTWVMSGVADSRREIGHGNIDANDPKPTCEHQW